MEEKKISVGEVKTNFKITGDGPAVLILHGWGSSSDSWALIQEQIAREGYKVVCPDLPGFGKSKTPPEPWGISEYVNWVFKFIDSQELSQFFLISHSFGGRIAIQFTNEYPDLVRGLVLCDAAGIKREPDLKTQFILLLAKVGNILLAPKVLTRLKDTARNVFYLFLRNTDYAKANKTMKETLKKVLEHDVRPMLPSIRVRTLIVWGRRDKMVPIEDAYILEEGIKSSKLKILPDVDHSPHLQAPDRLVELVLSFFKKTL